MQTVGWPRVMLLPEASPLWLAACRAKEDRARGICAEHGEAAAQLWEQTSGVPVDRTAFTLTLPIHDEERSLPSVLHALLGAWLPPNARVTVALISNACQDSSPRIIEEFLTGLGETESADLRGVEDTGLRSDTRAVRVGAIEFLHLDTCTPGKANALELGNAVARARGHRIAMSQDTNNWLEPDALAVLYGDAHRGLKDDGAALYYGTPVPVFRHHAGSLYNRMQRKQAGTPARADGERLELPGWMLAWDTEWLHAAGGVPHTATEDFALAVLARATGRTVGVSDARIWGYGISTISDLLAGARRFVRGELQLRALAQNDPRFAAAAEAQILHARPFRDRFARFRELAARRPSRFPVQLVKWLLWETGLALGRRDYRRDPSSASWTPIGSTK